MTASGHLAITAGRQCSCRQILPRRVAFGVGGDDTRGTGDCTELMPLGCKSPDEMEED